MCGSGCLGNKPWMHWGASGQRGAWSELWECTNVRMWLGNGKRKECKAAPKNGIQIEAPEPRASLTIPTSPPPRCMRRVELGMGML